jgi:ATP-binding cassette subfamily B protein
MWRRWPQCRRWPWWPAGADAGTGLAVDGRNADHIAALCRATDGLPLALELAAARLVWARRVGHSAVDGDHSEPADIGTGEGGNLEAAIARSYKLLTPAEQTLLRRLSVFPGSWTAAAADAICAEWGADTQELLTVLVDASLVVPTEHADSVSGYTLLRAIAEFAGHQLALSGRAARSGIGTPTTLPAWHGRPNRVPGPWTRVPWWSGSVRNTRICGSPSAMCGNAVMHAQHWEQQHFVGHRLDHYRAGTRMDYAATCPVPLGHYPTEHPRLGSGTQRGSPVVGSRSQCRVPGRVVQSCRTSTGTFRRLDRAQHNRLEFNLTSGPSVVDMSMETAAWMSLHRTMTAQQERRPFSWQTVRRIGGFARQRRRELTLFMAISVVTAVFAVATPLLAGRVVEAVIQARPLGVVVALALVIAGIAIAEAAFGLLGRWLSARIGEGLILDLRRAVFDHVQRMPVAFFTRTRTGALVSRLNNDVIGAQRAFSDTLSGVVGNLVSLVLALVAMITLSWPITLFALLLLPIFIIPARRMGGRLARLQREAAAHNAAMSTQMTERFSAPGATLVKLFADPARESTEFGLRAERVRDIGVRSAMVQMTFITALTLVSALALALVYGLGGFFALAGTLSAGDVVALALLITRLYAPLTALASARVEVMSALVSFERVFEVLDLEPLIAERLDAVAVPEGPAEVKFRGVDFAYPAADKVSLASLEEVATLDTRAGVQVLHDVSFTARPGEMVALVGSSGAGKSTIAQLAARLYDVDAGEVSIGGVDVRGLRFDSIRATLGMITQDGHLFHDTIRANLLLAKQDASDDELWSVLRRARLESLVAALPDELDTVVGERGYRLSGGERQRLTIARLLLAHPRVVILDEATAHLDSTSEQAVQAALDEALADRTSIVIAHRLSTVRAADQILVVEAGRIVERGQHSALLSAGGRYAELYRTQFRDQETGDQPPVTRYARN